MGKLEKLIIKLLSGNADKNFDFPDLLKILVVTGFTMRVKGSHHIFIKENVEEIINLQAGNEPYGQAEERRLKIGKPIFNRIPFGASNHSS